MTSHHRRAPLAVVKHLLHLFRGVAVRARVRHRQGRADAQWGEEHVARLVVVGHRL